MSRGRAALAAVIGLAAVALGFWIHRMELGQPGVSRDLLNADVFRYFHPTATFLHEQLRAGRLPWWNPYQMAGQPFIALQAGAPLYPPGLLVYALFEPARALAAHAVLHVFLAGLATWLLAGRIGLGAWARLAAAVTYMLSGPVLVGLYMIPYVACAAWLPAVLWTLTGLLQQARLRWAVGLALALAASFLAGHAQGTLYTVQLAALYGGVGLFVLTPRRQRRRVVGQALLGAVLTLCLVAPQLLPTLELTAQGVRSFEGLPFREAARPAVLQRALIHGLLHAFVEPPAMKSGLGPDQRLVDLPVLALPLMLLAFGLRGRRFHAAFFGIALVGLWAFLQGRHLPVFPMYYELPGGNLFRGPQRASFLYQQSGALLLGMGIECAARLLGRLPERAGRWLPGAAAALLAVAVGVDDYRRTRIEIRHPALEPASRGAPSELLRLLEREGGYERTFLQKATYFSRELMFKFGMMNGTFAVPDYEPTMPGGYATYFGVPDQPPWHGRLRVIEGGKRRDVVPPRLLDLMGVTRYVVPSGAPRMVEAVAERLDGEVEWGVAHALIRRPQALPRAWVVRHAIVAEDLPHAARLVRNPFFDPRAQAVVTDPDPTDEGSVRLRPADLDTRPAPGDRATITRLEAERVELEAHCGAPCLVVLSDLLYPGWVARVEGEPATIHPTNAIFRGVELPTGTHRIVYRFEPWSIRAGFALAGAGLAALAVGGALHLRRGRAAGSDQRPDEAGASGDPV